MRTLVEVPAPTRFVMVATICALWGLALVSCSGNETPTQPSSDSGGDVAATVTTTKSDNAAKSPVCHFQEDAGTWRLTLLPSKAASSHLAKHDDAVPGGTTAMTSTVLDEACQPVVASCPCFKTDSLVALFDPGEPFRPLAAGYGGSGGFFHDLCGTQGAGDPFCDGKYAGESWLAEVYYRYDSTSDTSVPNCYVRNWTTSTTVINIDISQAQYNACMAEVGGARPFLLETP